MRQCLLLLLLTVPYISECTRLSLDGKAWSAYNSNRSLTLQGSVPGDIYGDLLGAGLIGEPFYRYGDFDYRWVAYENWTYFRSFDIPELASYSSLSVIAEGLQVVAAVYVNGRLVGESNNQFRRYNFELDTATLKSAGNHIQIDFTSSVTYATEQYEKYAEKPKPEANTYFNGLPNRNFIRAEQSSFGWDWGPAFAPQGIYRSIYIQAFRVGECDIETVAPHLFSLPPRVVEPLTDKDNQFRVDFRVSIKCDSHMPGANSRLTLDSKAFTWSEEFRVNPGHNEIRATVEASNVNLWWPAGYGQQNLYPYTFTFSLGGSFKERLGFRSVELITKGDPLGGHEQLDVMFFRINGVPIFAKGANLIPFDAFQSRVNSSSMAKVLNSAIEANMNMVRVWGGGLFPTRKFYEMCDDLGLMVWQEMIFACAPYPVDKPFLDNVREEIRYQIGRLSTYSSIVMWSGNNENGVFDKGPGSPYRILDYDTVLQTIIESDTSRPIWPSSPSTGFSSGVTESGLPSGTQDYPEPFVAGGQSGDTHYYNYDSCPNVTLFPKTNFGSEYGFQSLPLFKNIESVSEQQDWSLFAPLMIHRQHQVNGSQFIANLLKQNFNVPDLKSTSLKVFKRVIYLTQLLQVLCVADEAAFYRRGRDMPYRTMGSLYWQLNQNWQAPSWTSMEYGGDWKLLHYAMARVYAKHMLSSFVDEQGYVQAHIASDSRESTLNLTAKVELLRYDGSASSSWTVRGIEVGPLQGNFFWKKPSSELLALKACRLASSCFLLFSLKDSSGRKVVRDVPLFLSPLKEAQLPDSKVTVSVITVSGAKAKVSVTASATTLFCFLQSSLPGRFNDNGFIIIPGREVELQWLGQQELQSKEHFLSTLSTDFLNDQ